MHVGRRKCANPRRAIPPTTDWPFFIVRAPHADRDKTLRMIVQIERPVITYEMMDIHRNAGTALEDAPTIQIRRASLMPINFFRRTEQPSEYSMNYIRRHHLPPRRNRRVRRFHIGVRWRPRYLDHRQRQRSRRLDERDGLQPREAECAQD